MGQGGQVPSPMPGSPGEAPAPPVLPRAALLRCLLALGLLLPLLLVPWGSQVLLRARLRVLLLFWFQRQGGRLFWQSWCCSTWGESTVEVTLRLRVFCLFFLPFPAAEVQNNHSF